MANSAEHSMGKLASGAMPPKLEDSVTLLATVVSDMQHRLGAMRDSALWRIIDIAQDIHKDQKAAELVPDQPPWKLISADEGLNALFCRLLEGEDQSSKVDAVASDDEVLD